MNDNWFRNKRYGLGWTPANWKGWAVIVLWFLAVIGDYSYLHSQDLSPNMLVASFSLGVFGLILLLIAVCLAKGEKVHWRWAARDISTKEGLKKTLTILACILIVEFIVMFLFHFLYS